MPFNARCKSRKEKNKLASRACRLKKKAQHEANKLKCMGLAEEHREYIVAAFQLAKCEVTGGESLLDLIPLQDVLNHHEFLILKSCFLLNGLISLIPELLVVKIERAREILRSKIDPSNTQPQAELSEEMEVMARKAQSE